MKEKPQKGSRPNSITIGKTGVPDRGATRDAERLGLTTGEAEAYAGHISSTPILTCQATTTALRKCDLIYPARGRSTQFVDATGMHPD